MPLFVEAAAEELGLLDFGPGESTLFLEAAETALEVELMTLLESPIQETEPDATHCFGGLEAEALEEAIPALDEFLSQARVTSAGLEQLCERHELQPQRFLDQLRKLQGFLKSAQQSGSVLVTLYD